MERSMTSSCKEKSTCKSMLQANDSILIKVSGYRSDRILLSRGEYFLQAKNEQVLQERAVVLSSGELILHRRGGGEGCSHSHPTWTAACGYPTCEMSLLPFSTEDPEPVSCHVLRSRMRMSSHSDGGF